MTVAKSPRYTTFAPGELESRLKELSPDGAFFYVTESVAQAAHSRGRVLLKEHRFPVLLPDGTEAQCRYQRLGSQYHRFEYTYRDGTLLPRQHVFARLANDTTTVEEKGLELAVACFREAVEWERKDYFARASEPSDGSRKKQPGKYRFNAKTAKELGGWYAVCLRAPTHLFPVSCAFSSLEKANAAWKEMHQPNTVVACCNRLDRCWELLKWNPLYAECDLRENILTTIPPMPQEGETGKSHCPNYEDRSFGERFLFASWMEEVSHEVEVLCGLPPEDLPDCPYQNWHDLAMTPQEAAEAVRERCLE
jgi:hypothetical protein